MDSASPRRSRPPAYRQRRTMHSRRGPSAREGADSRSRSPRGCDFEDRHRRAADADEDASASPRRELTMIRRDVRVERRVPAEEVPAWGSRDCSVGSREVCNSRSRTARGRVNSCDGHRREPPSSLVSERESSRRDRNFSDARLARGQESASRETRESSARRRRPRALFLMGLPGAGKTTVKRDRKSPQDADIEPDKYKRFHPGFKENMGDETDEEVHRWSVRRSVDAFDDVVNSRKKQDVIFDSSGSNAQWLRHRIELAKKRGYQIDLLWVDVPVEIALLRNRDRAAKRGERTMVPDKVIMDKADLLESSFKELKREADTAERFENWSKSGDELALAQDDLYSYPPPRTRPPGLRRGDKGYGAPPPGARSLSRGAGSRRTMRIGPWKRGDAVMKEKNSRLEWMDSTFKGNRERFVDEHVLGARDILLEPNRYPYQLPPDVEHWTIWNRKDMDHSELCEYMERWLDAREPHNVLEWNYDDNRGQRTIDIWHVHIYFRGRDGKLPRLRPSGTVADNRLGQSTSRHRSSPCSV